jgi:hypothetical protein
MRTNHASSILLGFSLLAAMSTAASAQSYPVNGKWTYENPSGDGPAKDCGKRYMDFQGERRFDKGGSVPDYRNLTVSPSGSSLFRLVDEFNTGQIRARSSYTLRKIDDDHIEIRLDAGGKTIPLRRCE